MENTTTAPVSTPAMIANGSTGNQDDFSKAASALELQASAVAEVKAAEVKAAQKTIRSFATGLELQQDCRALQVGRALMLTATSLGLIVSPGSAPKNWEELAKWSGLSPDSKAFGAFRSNGQKRVKFALAVREDIVSFRGSAEYASMSEDMREQKERALELRSFRSWLSTCSANKPAAVRAAAEKARVADLTPAARAAEIIDGLLHSILPGEEDKAGLILPERVTLFQAGLDMMVAAIQAGPVEELQEELLLAIDNLQGYLLPRSVEVQQTSSGKGKSK